MAQWEEIQSRGEINVKHLPHL